MNQIVYIAKRNPELIQLLEMHNQFKTITQYGDVSVYFATFFLILVDKNSKIVFFKRLIMEINGNNF